MELKLLINGKMGRPVKTNLSDDLLETLQRIGRNISAARSEKGISQAELARQAKISTTTLNEIESRQCRDIRVSTLSAIAAALDVSVGKLFASSDIDLSSRDQAQLLKASEVILKISRKIKRED